MFLQDFKKIPSYSFLTKIEKQLCVFRQVVLGIGRSVQDVIKSTFTNTIHRIYVPPPNFPVRYTGLDILVIYPVDISHTLLVTHSVPLSHNLLILHGLFLGFVRTDIQRHFRADRHTSATFTLGADLRSTEEPPGFNSTRAMATPAQGYFGFFPYLLFHVYLFLRLSIPLIIRCTLIAHK